MTPQQLLQYHDQGSLWSSQDRQGLPAGLPEAYQRALAVRRLREQRGEVPRGYKIGFTNRTIWPLYNVFAPIWGTVWAEGLVFCEGEATLSLAATCQPRIEPVARHAAQQVRGQMRHPDPGQDQQSRVVGQQTDVLQPRLLVPADEAVAAAQVARRRAPRRAGYRPAGGGFMQVLTLKEGYLTIGIGSWLGLIMALNVWVLIWPNQKKALGIVTVEAPIHVSNVMLVDPETGEVIIPEAPDIDPKRLADFEDQIETRDVTPDATAEVLDALAAERESAGQFDDAVDVQIVALRRKLGGFGGLIETVRGVGYRFNDRWSTQLGYRFMNFSQTVDGKDIETDLSGVLAGVTISF